MSERFPALIGLCVVDPEFAKLLRGELSTTTPKSMLPEFLGEFGVKANPGAEVQIATNFVSSPGGRALSESDSGFWQTACPGEQIAFMDPQSRRAILSD